VSDLPAHSNDTLAMVTKEEFIGGISQTFE